MGRLFGAVLRATRWFFIVVVSLAGLLTLVAYYLASQSTPDYGRGHRVEGPRAEIEILRDARAVPHIFAETEYDAFFGLGFAHAQDRLWQMTLTRATVQGRLSELAGQFAIYAGMDDFLLRVDVTMRALDLYGHSERSLDVQSEDTLRALDAYAAGVNAWLDIVREEGRGAGAPEILTLGAAIEPWRPEDSLAVFKLLGARLSGAVFDEIRRTRFLIGQRLRADGPARVDDLFPGDPGPAVTALPPFAALFGEEVEFAADHGAGGFDWPGGLNAGDFAGASNSWAAAASRSATRAPLLASDPHLGLTAPSIWYLARIEFPDGGTIGGTIAGIPAVLAGRNRHIAWAPTTLNSDAADIYMESIDPDDPDRYRTPAGWAAFQIRTEVIRRADGSLFEQVLRRTRNGPVLPLDWNALAEITPEGKAPALRWTLLSDEDRSLSAAMRLMRADSIEATQAFREDLLAPAQMLAMADRDGIALVAVGAAPLRRADSLTRGRVVSQGWREENDWLGYMPVEDLPLIFDPAGGIVANANNKVTEEAFPYHLGYDWPAPYRIQRLSQLLNNREFHTLSGFRSIQNDTISQMARGVLPAIAGPLWRESDRETGLRREALDLLGDWNGDMDPFLPEPLIFTAWVRALTSRLTEPSLDDLAGDYAGIRPLFIERVFRNVDGAATRWCEGEAPTAEARCAAIASEALDDALAELQAAYGDALRNWRWGEAHLAVHRHQPFGGTPLGFLFNISHETGGSDHTLRRGQTPGRGETPYRNVHAGGFRAIYDFADLDRSLVAISTGQSGHFLSRHYDDFSEIWRSGDYVPLSLVRQDAEAGAVGVTRLTPIDAP